MDRRRDPGSEIGIGVNSRRGCCCRYSRSRMEVGVGVVECEIPVVLPYRSIQIATAFHSTRPLVLPGNQGQGGANRDAYWPALN